MYYIEHDADFTPEFWFVALENEEIIGVSLCNSRIEEDPGMAWIQTLGVRRPWRKRGLGQALLQHSLGAFRQRGIHRAGLSVDTDNLTGALRLYEKAGMRPWRTISMYEYELRPGTDLMKKQVEQTETA